MFASQLHSFKPIYLNDLIKPKLNLFISAVLATAFKFNLNRRANMCFLCINIYNLLAPVFVNFVDDVTKIITAKVAYPNNMCFKITKNIS